MNDNDRIIDFSKPPYNALKYVYQKCPNCHGYATLGYAKVPCPTCKQTGVIKIPVEDLVIYKPGTKKDKEQEGDSNG